MRTCRTAGGAVGGVTKATEAGGFAGVGARSGLIGVGTGASTSMTSTGASSGHARELRVACSRPRRASRRAGRVGFLAAPPRPRRRAFLGLQLQRGRRPASSESSAAARSIWTESSSDSMPSSTVPESATIASSSLSASLLTEACVSVTCATILLISS